MGLVLVSVYVACEIIANVTAGRPVQLGSIKARRVQVAGDGDRVPVGSLLEIVAGLGARVALCEGGPHLFGDLIRARLVDDLFLTLAPQIVGRDANVKRLALVEGASASEGP